MPFPRCLRGAAVARLLLAVLTGGLFAVSSPAIAVALQSKVSNVAGNVPSGTSVTYTLTYRCDKVVGTCVNVTITDQFPLGFSVNPADVIAATNSVFTSVNYDQPTRTVTWTAPVLSAGQTGQLDLQLLIPAGSTANATVLSNTATITETGFPPGTATVPAPITVTAINTFQPDKVVASGGAVGGPTRWQIGLRNTSTTGLGVLNLQGPITFTDVLPQGVRLTSYEALIGGATTAQCLPALASLPVTAGAGGLTVTCTFPNTVSGASSPNGFIPFYTLKVVYPDPPFTSGVVSNNNISYNGTPLGEPNATVGPVARSITLQPPAANGSFSKGVNVPQIVYDIDDPLGWTITLSNTGNVINDSHVIVDTLPPAARFTLQSFRAPGSASNPLTVEYELSNSGSFIATGLANPYTSTATISSVPGGIGNITRIRWTFGGDLEPAQSLSVRVDGKIPAGVAAGTVIQNCADGSFSGLVGSTVTAFNRNSCSSVTTEAPRPRLTSLGKSASNSNVNPNGLLDYTVSFANRGNRRFTNFVLTDVLDPRLELVAGAFGGQDFTMAAGPAPTSFSYNPGTRTITATYALLCPVIDNPVETGGSPPCSATPDPIQLRFRVRVLPGTPATQPGVPAGPPAITNSATFSATQPLGNPGTTPAASISVRANAEIVSEKLVKGALDTVFSKVPDVGRTTQGGGLVYQMRISNVGNVAMQGIRIVDVLPNIGDTGIFDTTARDSQWRPVLTAPIVPPSPITVEYSTADKPCTPELGASLPGCTAPNWLGALPADPTTVKALRFNFNSRVLQPAETETFQFVMKAPVGSPTYAGPYTNPPAGANIAWNNFAFISTRQDNGNPLSAEPNKVGISVPPDNTHVSIGNYVWFDDDGNGLQNEAKTGAGARGVNGVRVFLLDAAGNPVVDATDPTGFLSTITGPDFGGNPGYYLFAGLNPGSWSVAFDPATFPAGWSVTRKNADTLGLGPNGADSQAAGGLNSDADAASTVTVTIGGAPRTLYRTTNATLPAGGDQNLSLDLGLIPTYALGNRVWFDTNNNGQHDSGEVGAGGVRVALLQETAPGSGSFVAAIDAAGAAVPVQVTNPSGYYRFDNLPPGNYRVRVEASNFAAGTGALSGYSSSTDIASTANPNGDLDRDDNGINTGNPSTDGVSSATVTLGRDASHPSADSEPTGETDLVGGASPQGGADARGNMTVDFGFYRLVVGNQVWFDTGVGSNSDNGVFDAGETPVVNLTVELRDGATDALIATTTTDASGFYRFDRRTDGSTLDPTRSYYIHIPTPPSGYRPSATVTNGPASGSDSRNNGTQPGGIGTPVRSAAFNVTPGAGAGGQSVDNATATTAQPTLDFGFFPSTFSIGNRVWFDTNNNGQIDPGEAGIANVRVEAYTQSNVLAGSSITDAQGYYRIDGLPQGTYTVRVPASNFVAGGALAGYSNSTFTAASGSTTDSRDHGIGVPNPSAAGISSGPVQVGPGLQPTGASTEADVTGTGQGAHGISGDDNDNLTIDFGFYRVIVGNQVWYDNGSAGAFNNGIFDTGEAPVVGVTVELRDALGNAIVSTTGTDGLGRYQFDRTNSGDPIDPTRSYYVAIPNPPGGTTPSTPVSAGIDSRNNGTQPGGAGNPIRSASFTIAVGATSGGQTVDNASATTVQPTLDFGLVGSPTGFSLGNRVWFDTNANGQIDPGEFGVAGVTVEVINGAGAAVGTAVTDALGYYRVDSLAAGTYSVRLPATNFTTGVLAGYTNLAIPLAPISGLPDSRNHGVPTNTPHTTGVTSAPVTLGPGAQPIAEPDRTGTGAGASGPAGDAADNLTIDFGFYRVAIGNRVWFDNGNGASSNNGILDAGEQPVVGLVMELRDGASNALVASTVTDGGGSYLFDRTSAGGPIDVTRTYVVQISNPPGTSVPSTPVTNGPATGLDNRNNGAQAGGAPNPVRSAVFSVVPGVTTGGQLVNNANATTTQPTLDFGFVGASGGIFSIGNRVWFDTDSNGVIDAAEVGVAGVRVEAVNTGGAVVAATLTDSLGYYRIDGLVAGTYTVRVAAANFQIGGPLGGYINSTPTVNSSSNTVDRRDNGIAVPNPTVAGISSAPVTVGPGLQPLGEPDRTGSGAGANGPNGDATDNLTVDFGFYRIVIGNFIWSDTGLGANRNNGVFDSDEKPIANISVELRDAGTNQIVASTQTDATGAYRFDRTNTGDPLDPTRSYYVNLPIVPAPVSTPNFNGPATGVDNRNNGQTSGGSVRTAVFTVVPGSTNNGQTVAGGTGTTTQPTLDIGLLFDGASSTIPIPTLSQWSLAALMSLLGLVGLGVLRRRP